MLFRFYINWLSDYTGEDEKECGYVGASNIGEAAMRVAAMYTGDNTHIWELKVWEVEGVLTDEEVMEDIGTTI